MNAPLVSLAHRPAGSSIRRAIRSELAELEALIVSSLVQFRGLVSEPILSLYIEQSRDIGSRWDEAIVLVAERDNRIAGTVTFYDDASRESVGLPSGWAGFRTLAVHPRFRGQGFGRMLMSDCIHRARAIGAEAVGIHTASVMTEACQLYESAGFRRQPEYDLFASELMGLDPALGEQEIIAYRLDL